MADLLASPEYKNLTSIIIYCMRQSDADELARYLRTVAEWKAESYHAGKPAKERTTIQKSFLDGKTPIICATIAFGLGINKRDVQAVIHYSLPKSIENYVQETGRAGRDGNMARCHLFLHNDDYFRLRSLSLTDSVDAIAIKRFLEMVLLGNHTAKGKKKTVENDRYLEIARLEKELDVRKTVLTTIMCYLATVHETATIRLLPSMSFFMIWI